MADAEAEAGGSEESDQPEGKYDRYVERAVDVLDLFSLFT